MSDSQKAYLTIYFFVALILSVIACIFVNPTGVEVGFFRRILLAIVSTAFCFAGALIGDFVRRLVIPDVIFTSGNFTDILKTKLFWFCGPQLIGILGGFYFAAKLVLPGRVR